MNYKSKDQTMEIIKKVFGEMLNNCYIIFDAESRDAYVIDPGYEAEEIAGIIAEKKTRS